MAAVPVWGATPTGWLRGLCAQPEVAKAAGSRCRRCPVGAGGRRPRAAACRAVPPALLSPGCGQWPQLGEVRCCGRKKGSVRDAGLEEKPPEAVGKAGGLEWAVLETILPGALHPQRAAVLASRPRRVFSGAQATRPGEPSPPSGHGAGVCVGESKHSETAVHPSPGRGKVL